MQKYFWRGDNMSKVTDYNEPHIVWYGIVSLFQFAQKYAAALRAYGEVYGDKESGNVYIDLSQEVIWRQLLSEISKIYDKKSTCDFDNCSIRQLRQCCLNHATAMHGKSSELIAQLDALCERYESLFSRELRNKKLAHYDLIAVFSQEPPPIPFDDVEQFINETAHTLQQIGDCLLGVEVNFGYDELVKNFQASLLKLTIGDESHDQL